MSVRRSRETKMAGVQPKSRRNARQPAKRDFLLSHIERVVFSRYNVTIVGSVPVQAASGETKLPFRIEGEIDRKAVRSGTYSQGAPRPAAGTSLITGKGLGPCRPHMKEISPPSCSSSPGA
jgi:hypothetical protein